MSSPISSEMASAQLKLLDYYDLSQILGRIESILWLIAALLAIIAVLLFLRMRKEAAAQVSETEGWSGEVEKAYNKADYETALDVLETARLLNPGSALVTYWQGRCYFQQQDWQKAAATFEELIRHEPVYRKSIKDYMAFIELNELVAGIEGYVDKHD